MENNELNSKLFIKNYEYTAKVYLRFMYEYSYTTMFTAIKIYERGFTDTAGSGHLFFGFYYESDQRQTTFFIFNLTK